MREFGHIGVIGGGAWGTALAQVAAKAGAGRRVTIWARETEVVDAINTAHENTLFLPGIALDGPSAPPRPLRRRPPPTRC